MNIMITGLLVAMGTAAAIVAAVPSASAATGIRRLEHYLEIAERAPFGEIAPSEAPVQAPVPAPHETFAQHIEMRAIIDDGNTIRVGFRDRQTQKTFSIALGETVDGFELVSVDYDNEEALLRKGMETSLFSLRSQDAADGRAAPGKPATQAASLARRRPSFTSRAPRRPPMGDGPDAAETMPYRGKTIEQFLREHPEAAMRHPSPLRPPDPDTAARHRGETIERFLREHPDAAERFSPFRPEDPSSRVEGRGEIIERFIREHSGDARIQPPMPVIQSPESVPFLFDDIADDEYYPDL